MNSLGGENNYRGIIKGTVAFGAVQFFQIIVNLIRGKFVALFLGPNGMGISSLYNVAGNTLCQFASLGLNLAIVKEIAVNKENKESLAKIVTLSRKLILCTAILGAFICIIFSPLLSKLTFGTTGYTMGFIALSIMVFFTVLGGGEMSILQGLHYVKPLSFASLIGASVGLIAGVPLYYFYGIGGIVPAMIILSVSMFVFYYYSIRRNIKFDKIKIIIKENKESIKNLISMGLTLLAGAMMGTVANYVLNNIIRIFGSIENVGLFQAANSIANQYVGMIFTAMALDYFPRLTAVSNDNTKMRVVVNRQIEVVLTLIAPIVCLLILTSPLIIQLLLTDSFYPILPLMRWMGIGIIFRALSFPMGYISFSKGNKKLFLWTEGILGNTFNLIIGGTMYYIFGLIGLGISIVVVYIIMNILYYLTNYHYYNYSIDLRILKDSFIFIFLPILVFVGSFIKIIWLSYFIMGVMSIFMCFISFRKLRRMFSVKDKIL